MFGWLSCCLFVIVVFTSLLFFVRYFTHLYKKHACRAYGLHFLKLNLQMWYFESAVSNRQRKTLKLILIQDSSLEKPFISMLGTLEVGYCPF